MPQFERRHYRLQLLHHVAVEPNGSVAVVRRRAFRDEPDRPAARQRDRRQLRDRIHLERRADAEEHVCLRRELRCARERRLRQQLAEQDDVRLERRAARAARHAVLRGLQPRPHLWQLKRRAALQARRRPDRAVDLDQVARPRQPVQAVDVLRDDRLDDPAALELHQRLVRAVRPLPAQGREAVAVELPEPRRVALEDLDVGDLHRVDVRPQPGARRAEVRNAGRHRDARAGKRQHPAGGAQQLRQPRRAGRCRRAQAPLNRGVRLPRNAPIPSRASSDANTVAKPAFSASMPSSRSPWCDTRLICSSASGACRANFRVHASAVSNSSWSGTTRLASPNSYASSAEIGSPVVFISSAFAGPTSRGSRWVPPKPGMMPRLISGWPNEAERPAIRTSQPIASSQPPPSAIPFTAAIVIVRERSNERSSAWLRSNSSFPPDASICVNALMSAPAQNSAGFGEATITALTLPSTSRHAASSASITCGESEFAGGLSSHSTATSSPRRSSLTGAFS